MKPKNILSMVLAVIMVIVMVPVTGVVAEEYTDGYYTNTVTDGKATITDVDTAISGDAVIPDMLGGCPVTSIGDYAFACFDILTILCYADS